MPLHRQCKARRILDINRLGRAVGRMAIDHDARAGARDPLAMQRVGHDLISPHQPVKHPAFGKAHRMTQGKDLVQRAFGGHAVVHAARQIADLGMQAAPHRHVDFLKPPADAQKRLATFDAGPHQGQGDRIAVAVKGAMGRGFLFAIFRGMHIRLAPGQKKAVKSVEELFDRYQTRVRGQDHRQAARHLGHGDRVDVTRCMHLIAVIHLMRVGNDPYCRPFWGPSWLCHGQPVLRLRLQHRKLCRQGEAPLVQGHCAGGGRAASHRRVICISRSRPKDCRKTAKRDGD